MILVLWTAEAREDRLDIWNFIAAENRSAANTLDLLFENAATNLARLPAMGAPANWPAHESFSQLHNTAWSTNSMET